MEVDAEFEARRVLARGAYLESVTFLPGLTATQTRSTPGRFGAVVIGAGHNGLVCAAYLAKAGISVLVVEARSSIGGCASTETAFGGALVNICNCDHAMIRTTPIAEELDLARHGLQYLDVEPSYLFQSWVGGPAWFLFNDVERTIESLGYSYPSEVENYRRYLRKALPVARMITDIGQGMPTPGSVSAKVLRSPVVASKAVPTLLQWTRRSVGDVVRSFFDTEQLRGPVVSAGPSVWGVGPDAPGSGLGAIGYALRHVSQLGRPVGGSGALTDAIGASLRAEGGCIRLSTRVTGIACEGTTTRGVWVQPTNDSGDARDEFIEAPIVVVATDPRKALVEWLRNPPSAAHALITRYRTAPVHDGYESKVDAVLTESYRANGVDDAMLARLGISVAVSGQPTMMVSKSLADLAADHALLQNGRIADRPQFFIQRPSALDPLVSAAIARAERHEVFSLEILWTPYELAGGWARTDEPTRWLRKVSELVTTESGRPFDETIDQWRLMGPLEYETQFSMHRGHAPSFSGTPITALLGRNPEQTRYETPVKGLFLTGAATFPGAGVWGAPGRNAATAILGS